MGDLPILFSPPMIRALLREIEQPGTGKTQTRRVLKPLPRRTIFFDPKTASKDQFQGPRYRPGDRLWVRETWKAHSTFEGVKPRDIPPSTIFYMADEGYSPSGSKRRPGIFMPRWASRLTLYVTEVKVERLQDISEADALAEGVSTMPAEEAHGPAGATGRPPLGPAPSAKYSRLWDTINGCGAWDANPWVVAYTFLPHLGNIDTLPAEARP